MTLPPALHRLAPRAVLPRHVSTENAPPLRSHSRDVSESTNPVQTDTYTMKAPSMALLRAFSPIARSEALPWTARGCLAQPQKTNFSTTEQRQARSKNAGPKKDPRISMSCHAKSIYHTLKLMPHTSTNPLPPLPPSNPPSPPLLPHPRPPSLDHPPRLATLSRHAASAERTRPGKAVQFHGCRVRSTPAHRCTRPDRG